MKHETIYKKRGRYASFPHVQVTPEGSCLVVFREAGQATAQAALTGNHVHQDNDSRILLVTRDADTEDWSHPDTVYEGDYAANDPAITILSNGRYLIRYARWHLLPSSERTSLRGPLSRHFVRTGQVGAMMGNGYMISDDHGSSWSDINPKISDPRVEFACSRDAVMELADGSLLLPVYCGYPEHNECAWVMRSWDSGRTWGDASHVAGEPWLRASYRNSTSYNETSVAYLGGNRLLGVCRADTAYVTEGEFVSEGGVGELMWTVSDDMGFTWEPVRPTGLWGQPAHLLLTVDGSIICTYGHRRKPYGVRAAEIDLGLNRWQVRREITLRDDGGGWDIGYPASAQLADGSICSVYYIYGNDQVRHIAATRWTLDEMISC